MRPWPAQGLAGTTLLLVVLLLVPTPVVSFLVRPPLVQTRHSFLTSSPPPLPCVTVVQPRRELVVVRQSTVPDGSDNMPPMPQGGESEYEYESEYSDQQAVRTRAGGERGRRVKQGERGREGRRGVK